MTKSQLKYLFEHVNLPVGYTNEEIDVLKKVLLLELKSRTTDSLEIRGKVWTRNDILEFFKGNLDQGFDEETFFENNSWAQLITDPGKIEKHKPVPAFDEEEMQRFRLKASGEYEQQYLEAIRKKMHSNDFMSVHGLITLLVCFNSDFRYRSIDLMKSSMTAKLNGIIDNAEAVSHRRKFNLINFMRYRPYYDVMAILGKNDTDLMILNLNAFGQGIGGADIVVARVMIGLQRTLPLPPEGEDYLDQLMRQMQVIEKQQDAAGGGEGTNIARVIGVVVAILLAVIRISTMRSRSSYNDYPINIPQYQNEIERNQAPVYSEEQLDSIIESQIERDEQSQQPVSSPNRIEQSLPVEEAPVSVEQGSIDSTH